jgi:hypothetical protein
MILTGLVKIDPCQHIDRWPQGYRASVVEFAFSDGTTQRAKLADLAAPQLVTFTPIATEWVRITPIDTRPPLKKGVAAYTAISEISVLGAEP